MVNHDDKRRAVLRNVLYGFSMWVLPLGLSFVVTPVIVRALGNEDYGIYALVLGFISYSFNFSLGRAITKYIAEYRHQNEEGKIREIVSATFFLNVAVGGLGTLIICLAAGWLARDVFMIEPARQESMVHALYLSALIIFFAMLNQVFTAILQGLHRFDAFSKFFNLINIGLILGNLVLVLNGFGMIALLAWNLVNTIVSCLVFYFAARALLPVWRLDFDFRRESLGKVFRFSRGVVGYQLLANLFLLFERSWITRKLGAESLTYYILPMMLAIYLHGFVSSLMMVVFPLASELNDERERLLRLYLKATKIVCALVVFLALTLMVESEWLLTLWVGPDFGARSADLLILHTITFGLAAVYIISFQMAEGLGHPGFNFLMMGVGAGVGIPSMIVLSEAYGIYGAALGRTAAFTTIFLSTFYLEKWIFGRVQWRFWLRTAGMLLLAAALAAAAEKYLVMHLPRNWYSFLGAVALGATVYGAALWALGFVTAEEKELVRKTLRLDN